jgi:hypothetical protein
MLIGEAVEATERRMVEVVGQLTENGADHHQFREAVRGLAASVEMLAELAEGGPLGGA